MALTVERFDRAPCRAARAFGHTRRTPNREANHGGTCADASYRAEKAAPGEDTTTLHVIGRTGCAVGVVAHGVAGMVSQDLRHDGVVVLDVISIAGSAGRADVGSAPGQGRDRIDGYYVG